jgi:glycosyltransferase involved in cell wall biosynthesis
MKIIQVVPTVCHESDGVNHAVRGMSRGLASCGVRVELHCLDEVPEVLKTAPYQVVNAKRERFPIASIGRSPEMETALKRSAQDADIIHSNGLWMMPNIYPEWAIRGTKCKLVVQPHGTLSRWAMKRSWWKKMPLWWLWQKRVLDKAEMLVATCDKEYKEIRALGYKQPIVVLPIGLDVPTLGKESTEYAEYTEKNCQDLKLATGNWKQATEHNRLRRIVFFGRVHKVKAVDNLVKAWGALHADLLEWELVIAGPDCGAKADLEAIIAEGNIPRVRFTGEINGQAKYDFLTDADIYVLPSHTENFGVTVAEALACGTPSIASQGTPWEGLETEQCGKWVPIGVEPLVTALRELTSLTDEERAAMGQRGIEWIRRDFSWEGIGAKMKAAYAWLLGQGEKPDFVRVD